MNGQRAVPIKTLINPSNHFLMGSSKDEFNFYGFLQVEMPKGEYKGQKLIKLVRIKTAAKINKTIAIVPEITFVKYKLTIVIAKSTLTVLSIVPIFAFMFSIFKLCDEIELLKSIKLQLMLHKRDFISA